MGVESLRFRQQPTRTETGLGEGHRARQDRLQAYDQTKESHAQPSHEPISVPIVE
jgi:hypothetical protein